jgi:hypothetical protein
MKAAKNLSHEALVEIAETVQGLLYLDIVNDREVFNPEKEWSGADVCEALAGLCTKHKLAPSFLGEEP